MGIGMIAVMDDSVFKARAGIADGFEFINGYLIVAMWVVWGVSKAFFPQAEVVFFGWAFASTLLYGFKYLVPLFRSDYQLIFKDDFLMFQQGDAVLWTLPYENLSHIGAEKLNHSGTKFVPLIEELFVYTHSNEKFLIPPYVFELDDVNAIQREIEIRKATL